MTFTYLVPVNGVLYESRVFVMGETDVVKKLSLPLHGPNQIIGALYFVLRTTRELRWLVNVNRIGFSLWKSDNRCIRVICILVTKSANLFGSVTEKRDLKKQSSLTCG